MELSKIDLDLLASLSKPDPKEDKSIYARSLAIVSDPAIELQKKIDAIIEAVDLLGKHGYDLLYSLPLKSDADLLLFQLPPNKRLLQGGAKVHHPACYIALGRLYFAMGYYDKSLAYLKKAALSKDPEGSYYYACAFMKKEYGPIDREKAWAYMDEAVKKGSKRACWYLASGYFYGTKDFRGHKSIKKALHYLELGAKMDEPHCLYLLAKILLGEEKGVSSYYVDKKEGIDWMEKAARFGFPLALKEMGDYHLREGKGNLYVACGYFLQASEQGESYSALACAVLAILGIIELPRERFLRDLELALMNEDAKIRKVAMDCLANAYRDGFLVEPDSMIAKDLIELDVANRPDENSRLELVQNVQDILTGPQKKKIQA